MTDLTHVNTYQPDYHHVDSRNDRVSISSSESTLVSPISPMSPENNSINWGTNEQRKRSTKRGVNAFIGKLFSIVNDRKYQYLISWNPKGTSFLIYNASRFAQEVLPENFKHSNFSSFVRQLNMYGFHKINKSSRSQRGNSKNGIWEFSHIKFQRDCPELLEDIRRKSIDSEILRRETGDIHASFNMVQLSQAELLQQFNTLQENFEDLFHDFEDLRRTQFEQQIIINKLAEREGIHVIPSFNEFENNNNRSCQPSLLVTSPSSSVYKPYMPQEVMTSPMYPTQKVNGLDCQMDIHRTLPPSPVSTAALPPSPSYTYYDQNERDQKKYVSLQ